MRQLTWKQYCDLSDEEQDTFKNTECFRCEHRQGWHHEGSVEASKLICAAPCKVDRCKCKRFIDDELGELISKMRKSK